MTYIDPDAPAGIGGWLQVLCRLLTLWHPVIYGLAVSMAFNAVAVRGRAVAFVIAGRLLVVAIGVGAGVALRNQRAGAPALAKASLALSAAMDIFVYSTPYYPSNRMPGDTPLYIAATVAYYGAWLAYVSRSRRVRKTFQ